MLQAFQDSDHETEQFRHRLIELVTRAIHAIAVHITAHGDKIHDDASISEATTYQEPTSVEYIGKARYVFEPLKTFASLFFHALYTAYEQYPFGASELSGYWAESRIFGGVVLFDRGESGEEVRMPLNFFPWL